MLAVGLPEAQGFPVAADMAGDGRQEVISESESGALTVTDLETGRILWSHEVVKTRVEAPATVAN